MKTRHFSSLCALVLLATLSGCSPTPAPSASSSATASTSESTSSSPTPEATPSSSPTLQNWEEIPSRKASLTQGKEDANHAPVFHDLRVGEHDTFYRVVVEFTGSDDVGWQGGWTTSPATQGKGDPIDLGTPIYGLKDKKSWWRVSPSCFGGGLCGGGRARRWRRPIWG